MKKLLVLLFFIPSIVQSKTLTIPPACLPYVTILEKYSWNVQTAVNVMYAESGCNPNAVNLKDVHKSNLYPRDYPSGLCHGSFSLFQTGCQYFISYDPTLEIAMAYKIYKTQGWKNAWYQTCHTVVKCYN